jgi:hypothetical protein
MPPMMCDPNDPAAGCPQGEACACGGPGASITCTCGAVCGSDADCTNPAQPLCCGGGAGATGICTDQCLCLCD